MEAERIIPIAFLFGVEIETVLKLSRAQANNISELYDEEDWKETKGSEYLFLIDLLANRGIPVNGSRHHTGISRDWTESNDMWSFKCDASIVEGEDEYGREDPNYIYLGVEITSRVLPARDEGFHEVVEVLDIIKSRYQLIENSSCGLHVHVGVSQEDKSWPLGTLKRFAQLILAFDHQINSLHPDRRVSGNKYCVQNSEGELLQQPNPFLRGKAIELCTEGDFEEGFIKMMNANLNREMAYNFTNLSSIMYPKTTKRTIEWRQHEGTSDGLRIRAWCEFATGLVKYAHETPQLENLELLLNTALNDSFTILDLFKAIGLDHLANFYSDRIFERPRPIYRRTQIKQPRTLKDLQDQLREEQLIALEEGRRRNSLGACSNPGEVEGCTSDEPCSRRGSSSYAESLASSRCLSSSSGKDPATYPRGGRSGTRCLYARVSYHCPEAKESPENLETLNLCLGEDSNDLEMSSAPSSEGSVVNLDDLDGAYDGSAEAPDDSRGIIHSKLDLMEYRMLIHRRPVLQSTRFEAIEFEDIDLNDNFKAMDLNDEPQQASSKRSTKRARSLSPQEVRGKHQRISQWISQL